jgi:hypothetical protein
VDTRRVPRWGKIVRGVGLGIGSVGSQELRKD